MTAAAMRQTSRYDLDRTSLAALVADLPSFRAEQLWHALYHRLAEPSEAHELPAKVRERLAGVPQLRPALFLDTEQRADGGTTAKWLFRLNDGAPIETVLMHHPRHSTVCVSSQAGCAMGCSFCATGQAGFRRNLSTGEIVEQVVQAARAARSTGRRLDHVVFMGMGEPLANLPRVWQAVERINDDIGIAARHLTISTVGVVPGIRRLAGLRRQVNLAVSLHAANDRLRDQLVPLNRRYPLAILMDACRDYVDKTHRRISFEWALIDGVNDRPGDAAELASLAARLGAHVNLIPLNPTPLGAASGLAGSPPERVRAFAEGLSQHGVNATVRRTRGRSIDAACGQLAGTWSPAKATLTPLDHPRRRAASRPVAGRLGR
jgi:23S rRNA (adenine2503-C2)-methyltransferase